MSSFNVAQILPSLDSGGVERGTIEVANYLSELNLKNNICLLYTSDAADDL